MGDTVRILVVEDEFVTGLEIRARLGDMGYEVLDVLCSGEEAITKAGILIPDIMIMDITLSGEMNGIEAADIIRKKYSIPVIFLTAHSDDATIQNAIHSEPFGYLIKPLDERVLSTTIRMALYKHAMDKVVLESEQRYRSIAELIDDALLLLDSDNTIQFLNTQAKQFFNIHPETLPDRNLRSILPASLADQIEKQIKNSLDRMNPARETLNYSDQGEEFWLDCSVVPVIPGEEVSQVIVLLHDVSEMVRIKKEIEKRGIAQIEKNMEQFMVLNDRIRNPLAIIMTAASLHENKECEEILKQVNVIDDLVDQLDRGWVQSEAVRAFLLRHYGQGTGLD
jgi:PAS domain S-box-containing protein